MLPIKKFKQTKITHSFLDISMRAATKTNIIERECYITLFKYRLDWAGMQPYNALHEIYDTMIETFYLAFLPNHEIYHEIEFILDSVHFKDLKYKYHNNKNFAIRNALTELLLFERSMLQHMVDLNLLNPYGGQSHACVNILFYDSDIIDSILCDLEQIHVSDHSDNNVDLRVDYVRNQINNFIKYWPHIESETFFLENCNPIIRRIIKKYDETIHKNRIINFSSNFFNKLSNLIKQSHKFNKYDLMFVEEQYYHLVGEKKTKRKRILDRLLPFM